MSGALVTDVFSDMREPGFFSVCPTLLLTSSSDVTEPTSNAVIFTVNSIRVQPPLRRTKSAILQRYYVNVCIPDEDED